ncbi:hypothetical protein BV25DRAFT_1228892 [Artomyces pyxidatus]|uniref:Uncharacterized protein n=1 Tax=Artomyces pyxidatus TaxID=48021 RepID=A0ACB8SQ99_9AGAM|nr:hypothetical protein BV25DRAFT_1228892 [Artomyces pyxidatus]
MPRGLQAMLTEMPLLEWFNIRYNAPRESPVDAQAFEGLPHLRVLTIRYNGLSRQELSAMSSWVTFMASKAPLHELRIMGMNSRGSKASRGSSNMVKAFPSLRSLVLSHIKLHPRELLSIVEGCLHLQYASFPIKGKRNMRLFTTEPVSSVAKDLNIFAVPISGDNGGYRRTIATYRIVDVRETMDAYSSCSCYFYASDSVELP